VDLTRIEVTSKPSVNEAKRDLLPADACRLAFRPCRTHDVNSVQLEPTRESERRKTLPFVVLSPDELDVLLCSVIVRPMTKGAPNLIADDG